jgi:hypothetical protein
MSRFELVTRGRNRRIRAWNAHRQNALRGRSLALCGLSAYVAAFAFAAPAGATSKPALIAQAKVVMQKETAFDESHRIIPFKVGTKFVISCSFGPDRNIHCTEHTGPERCVNGRPWVLLSDIFPVIDGKVGSSLAYGLVPTDNYCKH